jgi:hypothetical protein
MSEFEYHEMKYMNASFYNDIVDSNMRTMKEQSNGQPLEVLSFRRISKDPELCFHRLDFPYIIQVSFKLYPEANFTYQVDENTFNNNPIHKFEFKFVNHNPVMIIKK